MISLRSAGAFALFLGLSTGSLQVAQAAPRHPPKPPPEAFEACDDKAEGDDCTVSFRDTSLEGVCVKEDQETVFCLPNDMPEPPQGGPGGGHEPPPR